MVPEPTLFTSWYDTAKWVLNRTEKFPKKVRFTFSSRIDDLALDILVGVVEARYSGDKLDILKRVNLDLEKLRVLLRMCHDLGYLDHKGYEHAARRVDEAGKMAGGWRKQQEGGPR